MGVSRLRALLSGYPRRLWGEKLLVMLQAYVDDSIARTGDRRLFLAAYVLTAEQWEKFTEAWQVALDEEPAIPYFHMVEANGRSRDGCFGKFSIHQRNKKVFRMAQVIRDFAPHGLHASVSTIEFKEILEPYVPYPMKSPYFPLCWAIIYGLARLHEQLGLKMKCDVIFDDHPGLAGRVLPMFDLLAHGQESWRELIGGKPSFLDDKEVLPLQAADLLAWHLRRQAEGVEARDYEGILDLLTVNDAHFMNVMDTEVLQRLAEGFKSIPAMQTLASKRRWNEVLEVADKLFWEEGFETAAEAAEHYRRIAERGKPTAAA